MKVIININENVYTRLFDNGRPMDIADGIVMERAIRNGTPIPDNATNSDVMLTMFPDETDLHTFARHNKVVWWNALYQKGGTNRKNCEYRHENGNCLKVGGFCTSVDNEHCVKGGKE